MSGFRHPDHLKAEALAGVREGRSLQTIAEETNVPYRTVADWVQRARELAKSEGRDPLEDYAKLDYELKAYSEEFTFKHRIIAANKMDLPRAAGHLKRFKKKYQEKIIPVSALKKEGLTDLVGCVRDLLCQENSQDL